VSNLYPLQSILSKPVRSSAIAIGFFLAIGIGSNVSAQEPNNSPLSVIDWFNQHQTSKPTEETNPQGQSQKNENAISAIEVSVLPPQAPDAVGLTSSTVSGFAASIWQSSESEKLGQMLDDMPAPRLPSLSILLTRLMVTEATAPSGPPGNFLAARVRMLIKLGDVEPALALLDRAGPETSPEIFQLWADLTLLTAQESRLCEKLAAEPSLSPGYDYLIYCLVRTGDWNAAAATLLAAEALGELDPDTTLLLTRFLDPELFEDAPSEYEIGTQTTPLTFRLYEGIGEPWPTEQLPLAFAHADLRGLSGWRAQIIAAERLARTGAVSENLLLGVYTANKPSATGGVWDRVAAVQNLEAAISERDVETIEQLLPNVWESMGQVGLRHAIANLFSDDLTDMDWRDAKTASLVHQIGLLSRSYESVANTYWPTSHREAYFNAVATGTTVGTTYTGYLPDAIRAGFSGEPSAEQTFLLARNSDGEALLTAISSVASGRDAYPSDISHAISTFQVLGLGDIARQFSLQLMLSSDPL
jgi:hypothetical protein